MRERQNEILAGKVLAGKVLAGKVLLEWPWL
jgi:hypothetical protein